LKSRLKNKTLPYQSNYQINKRLAGPVYLTTNPLSKQCITL